MSTSTLLSPGDRCDGHEIIRHLATGRFAEVYAARTTSTGDVRALKIMAEPGDEEHRARFAREGEALALLKHHPNVVGLHDAGTWGGRSWLSLELVPGVSLRRMLSDGSPPSLDEILDIFQRVSAGLAEVHGRGIVHRDLCLENILVAPGVDGAVVKVIDFGSAAYLSDASGPAAGVGTAQDPQVCSARYLAPEVACGEPATPSADIYALGLLLYEALAGEHPMGDAPRDALSAARWHVRGEARPLRELASWVPPRLEAFVHQAIEKDPADRPARMLVINARLLRERVFLQGALQAARDGAFDAHPFAPASTSAPAPASTPMAVAPDEEAPDTSSDTVRDPAPAGAYDERDQPVCTVPSPVVIGEDAGGRWPLLPVPSLASVAGERAGLIPTPSLPPPSEPAISTWIPLAPAPVEPSVVSAAARSTDAPVERTARPSPVAPRRTLAVIGAGIVVLAASVATVAFLGGWTGASPPAASTPRPAVATAPRATARSSARASSPATTPPSASASTSASALKPSPTSPPMTPASARTRALPPQIKPWNAPPAPRR